MVNILILASGNSEICNINNLTFWATEILCSYMKMKILLQFPNFKIHSTKIHFSFIILRKISENSIHFSQFKYTLLEICTYNSECS